MHDKLDFIWDKDDDDMDKIIDQQQIKFQLKNRKKQRVILN